MSKGRLVVISGPSGVGKSTIVRRLLDAPEFHLSVSATTRKPRPDEVNGRDYFFLTREEFKEMVQRGEFLEYAEVYGELYGTPLASVNEALEKGKTVLLEIDPQGARQVKKLFPDSLLIFIIPPSLSALKERLCSRPAQSQQEKENRLKCVEEEISYGDDYDYRVVNDDLDRAVQEIREILKDGGRQ